MKAKTTNKKVATTRATSAVSKARKRENKIDFDGEDPAMLPISIGGSSFSTTGGFNYIPFLGNQDNLFRRLLELRLCSVTQGNCIKDKAFYSVGGGLQVKDQENFPPDFDKKINGKNQTIDDILKSIFESFYQDGNKFIEIVRQTFAGSKYVSAYPHNNMDCRFEENKEGGDPEYVIISKELRRDGIYNYSEKNKPRRVPLWSDSPLKKLSAWQKDESDPNIERTIIHIKDAVEGVDCYGLPANYAGSRNAWIEFCIAQFHIDEFDNNLFLSGLLMLQGSHTEEEEIEITNRLLSMYTKKKGGKARRIMAVSSESGIENSKFVPLNEKFEGHFVEFDKRNEDKIISANQWSKSLLDMNDAAGLGKGGSFLATLFKTKFATIIQPSQQNVLNNFIFPLMGIIDEWKGTKFYNLPWTIKPVIPVSLEGDLDINSLLTVDEGRQEIGRQPLNNDQGKKMIKEIGPAKQPATDQGGQPS